MLPEKNMMPYHDLYVYELSGLAPEGIQFSLDDGFIGDWVEDNSSYLFFESPAERAVGGLLKQYPGLELVDDYHIAYDQWQGGGLDLVGIGPFLIRPPWVEAPVSNGLMEILLDPSVVFGNGLHPTTRDCLEALAYLAGSRPLRRVMDLGTGTGILALAAAFLGAERVVAVDLNPLCVQTAERNVKLNDLEGKVFVTRGFAEDSFNEPADLVVANIHYDVVKRLLESEGFEKKKQLIVSGLMRTQAPDIKDRLERRGFKIEREWDHEMTWYTILAGKSK
jgi:ribosomal protein L11 methyltransferase